MTDTIEQLAYRRTFMVPCLPERAFEEWTAALGGWWPHDHQRGPDPVLGIGVEPRVGGEWYERPFGGGRVHRGPVLAWEPPRHLVLGWPLNFGQSWDVETQGQSVIEVRFTQYGEASTYVELEHRDMQLTPNIEVLRRTFFGPYGWDLVVNAYTAYLASEPWPAARLAKRG